MQNVFNLFRGRVQVEHFGNRIQILLQVPHGFLQLAGALFLDPDGLFHFREIVLELAQFDLGNFSLRFLDSIPAREI